MTVPFSLKLKSVVSASEANLFIVDTHVYAVRTEFVEVLCFLAHNRC
jgi:hypothetical protein